MEVVGAVSCVAIAWMMSFADISALAARMELRANLATLVRPWQRIADHGEIVRIGWWGSRRACPICVQIGRVWHESGLSSCHFVDQRENSVLHFEGGERTSCRLIDVDPRVFGKCVWVIGSRSV